MELSTGFTMPIATHENNIIQFHNPMGVGQYLIMKLLNSNFSFIHFLTYKMYFIGSELQYPIQWDWHGKISK